MPNKDIPKLCKEAHPFDEKRRFNLFKEKIAAATFESNAELIRIAKNFINELSENALVREALDLPEIKRASTNQDAFHLGRMQTRFKYLSALLGNERATTLHRKVVSFSGRFNGPINFHDVDSVAYVLPSEVNLMRDALENSSFRPPLIKMNQVTSYLRSKVSTAPELTPEQVKNYQISFGDFATTENCEEVNLKFRQLLQYQGSKDSPDFQNDVLRFFENILDTEINPSQKSKLAEFLINNKNEMALILQREGGVSLVVQGIDLISKDCVANIGTNIHSIVEKLMITDPVAHAIYSTFSREIFISMLNDAPYDSLSASNARGLDILNSRLINEGYVSPAGFIKSLERIFDEKSSFELIEKVGEVDYWRSKFGDYFDSNVTKIATYVTLKNSLPQILTGSSLEEEMDKSPSSSPITFGTQPLKERVLATHK